jgi:hypothetical protein
MSKTPKQLDLDIALARHLPSGATRARLVILDERRDDEAVRNATRVDVVKFTQGRLPRHEALGIRYRDRDDNDVAVRLTIREATTFLDLI